MGQRAWEKVQEPDWSSDVCSSDLMDRGLTCKASLSMEFFRQEYWSQLPFLSPGDLPHPGI